MAKKKTTKKATKKTTSKKGATRANMRAVAKADQENARLAEQRAKSPDGMTASERAMATSAKPGGAKKKSTSKKNAKTEAKPKKLSLIDAAAQVLGESKEPMNCKQMVDQVITKKLWSTDAPTPHATLYSSILREIQNKGDEARFTKVDRGLFTRSAAGSKKGA
ncbi:MAG: hypothetical protein GC159_03510 [Phycisphaera sp.]|nr:hypothetical protein [Phycisphaera sp.]